jgi:hypothetical protein
MVKAVTDNLNIFFFDTVVGFSNIKGNKIIRFI